jgi:hypothetical protein
VTKRIETVVARRSAAGDAKVYSAAAPVAQRSALTACEGHGSRSSTSEWQRISRPFSDRSSRGDPSRRPPGWCARSLDRTCEPRARPPASCRTSHFDRSRARGLHHDGRKVSHGADPSCPLRCRWNAARQQ